MAITLADFTRIWASTSPLTPYPFSDANYQEGWNFIGSTPPARQMWDSLQKQNDEKLKYIVDNFLPTSGGIMTGDITLADAKIEVTDTTDNVNGYLQAYGWGTLLTVDSDDYTQAGAKITLNTKNPNSVNNGNNLGLFSIVADDGVNNSLLERKPNGVLNWNGDRVQTAKQYSASITPASGFDNYNSANPAKVYRVGNMVQIHAILKTTSQLSDAEHTMFTLPNGYRPIDEIFEIKQGSSTNRWLLKITSGGVATIERYGTTSSGTIASGAWLPFSATFITTNAYPS